MKASWHRRFSLFSSPFVLSVVLIFLQVTYITAQGEEAPVIINKIPKHIPLKIELINKEKKEVVKELQIKVTNTADRSIYKLNLFLTVLDILSPDGNKYGFSLVYGNYRTGEGLEIPAQADDIYLKPGESYVFQVKKKLAEMFKRGRERRSEQYPKRFEVEFHFLIFGDGTGFLDTSGSPFPDKPRAQGNLTSPNFIELPLFTLPVTQKRARESPTFQNDKFNKLQVFNNSLFFIPSPKSFFLSSFFNQNNFDDYPCCHSGGNGCAQVKIEPSGQECCIHPRTLEVLSRIEFRLQTASGYSCQPGYSCKRFSFRSIPCDVEGYEPYNCGQEPVTEDCDAPPASCTPTGHGEGSQGYEYECSDGIDNDCDEGNPGGGKDCADSSCLNTQYCEERCDVDKDNEIAESCNGRDCQDSNPAIATKDGGEVVKFF